jgi:hypothetical protein
MSIQWKVDECSSYSGRLHVRGWCFQISPRICGLEAVFPDQSATVPIKSFGLPSLDVSQVIHPAAANCRIDEWIDVSPSALGRDFKLLFRIEDGSTEESDSVISNASLGDPFFGCWDHFIDHLRTLNSGTVLEMGSRARSAITYRHLLPSNLDYIGMDILGGPNVDVVGDAHKLEELFGKDRFVAAFSRSLFEHLAMPWKVALELNKVLLPGSWVYTGSHQTWPLHEEPWDFWRFSRNSWKALSNTSTGFEIVETAYGEPARIHPIRAHAATRSLPDFAAYLGSASIVQKVSETHLTWPVPLEVASEESYPVGELQYPPS